MEPKQNIFVTVFAFIKQNAVAIIAVLVLILGSYYFYLRQNTIVDPTITLHPRDFKSEVSVSGKIVASAAVEMSFDQSGRVAAVYKRVGDSVAAGTVLANIENGDVRAALLQKQAALQTEQANLLSLKNGTRPEEIAVKESAVASAQSALEQSRDAVVNALSDSYTKADDAVRNKIDQFITNPRSSNPQLSFMTNNSQLAINIGNERLRLENVMNEWQVINATLSSNSKNLAEIENLVETNTALVSTLLSDAGLALNSVSSSANISQSTIDSYKSDISLARTAMNSAITSLTTAVTAEKSAEKALDTAQKNLTLAKAGATAADIDAQKARVVASQADVLAAQAKLSKTMIVAPFSGVITKMDAKVGQIAQPSMPLIALSSIGTFQIETYIPEVSVAGIAVGNPAKVTLDAYGDSVSFDAKVISVDPAETVRDGVSTYKTKLEFVNEDGRLKSGMTANVIIVTSEKKNALVIPQSAIVLQSGGKFVTVVINGKKVLKPIVVGTSSSIGDIEVVSGLSEGDVVVTSASTE